jgi:hypothetical protein
MNEEKLKKIAQKDFPWHFSEIKRLEKRIQHRPVKTSLMFGFLTGIPLILLLEVLRAICVFFATWIPQNLPQLQDTFDLRFFDGLISFLKGVSIFLTFFMFVLGYYKGLKEKSKLSLLREDFLLKLSIFEIFHNLKSVDPRPENQLLASKKSRPALPRKPTIQDF